MNGSRSSSGSCWTCGPRTIVLRNSRGSSGSRGAGLQPALRRGEAGRQQPFAGLLGAGVVPGRPPAGEVLGVGLALADLPRPFPAGRRCCPCRRTARPAGRRDAARRGGARTAAGDRRSSGRWPSRGSRRPARSSSQLEQVARPSARRARRAAGGPPRSSTRTGRRAITRPRGRRSISASVIRPEPQPASITISSPLSSRRSRTSRPSASMVAEMRS